MFSTKREDTGFSLWSFMKQMSVKQAHCYFVYHRYVSGYTAQSRQEFIPQFSAISQMFFLFNCASIIHWLHKTQSVIWEWPILYTTTIWMGNLLLEGFYSIVCFYFLLLSGQQGCKQQGSRRQSAQCLRESSSEVLIMRSRLLQPFKTNPISALRPPAPAPLPVLWAFTAVFVSACVYTTTRKGFFEGWLHSNHRWGTWMYDGGFKYIAVKFHGDVWPNGVQTTTEEQEQTRLPLTCLLYFATKLLFTAALLQYDFLPLYSQICRETTLSKLFVG